MERRGLTRAHTAPRAERWTGSRCTKTRSTRRPKFLTGRHRTGAWYRTWSRLRKRTSGLAAPVGEKQRRCTALREGDRVVALRPDLPRGVSPLGAWLSDTGMPALDPKAEAGGPCLHEPAELNRMVLEQKKRDGLLRLMRAWLVAPKAPGVGIEAFGPFYCGGARPVLHAIAGRSGSRSGAALLLNCELKPGWARGSRLERGGHSGGAPGVKSSNRGAQRWRMSWRRALRQSLDRRAERDETVRLRPGLPVPRVRRREDNLLEIRCSECQRRFWHMRFSPRNRRSASESATGWCATSGDSAVLGAILHPLRGACYRLFKSVALPVSPNPAYTLEMLASCWSESRSTYRGSLPTATGHRRNRAFALRAIFHRAPRQSRARRRDRTRGEGAHASAPEERRPALPGVRGGVVDRMASSTLALSPQPAAGSSPRSGARLCGSASSSPWRSAVFRPA
ncbi:hypothetical protein Q5P01_000311 [Channa striata]|uniref:Uncharacterized protein n=1 Tax=Channa striata TaxID=64152 RepID=A0AA88LMG5_CHASR|nr:hypothetical protein Q5P01_000311 [Channa striata]